MPKLSCRTFVNGARQFVVHDAFETTLCLLRIVLVLIYAKNDCDVLIRRGRRNNNFLYAALQVSFGFRAVGEVTCRFDNDLSTKRRPVNCGRILGREDLEWLSINADGVAFDLNVGVQPAQDRVVLQKVSQCLCVSKVVGCNELDSRVLQAGPKHISPDTAEAVDSHFDWH